jgi:hypothetical protein
MTPLYFIVTNFSTLIPYYLKKEKRNLTVFNSCVRQNGTDIFEATMLKNYEIENGQS